MTEPSIEQIRSFRLRAHHLDAEYDATEAPLLVGACGMQNSPPGAWETALFNRAPSTTLAHAEKLLDQDKALMQAWSLRGAPYVFPTAESSTFLTPLCAQSGELWIYTRGIELALNHLDMSFDTLLHLIKQVIPKLDATTITSKTALDQTLAQWMEPLLPAAKRSLWNTPSMYGNPDKQTVGGAAVSFLLRPCSFEGLVVFGQREGISPTFTSYKNWLGEPLRPHREAARNLTRKFIHCYGPTTLSAFEKWLGASRPQALRLWNSLAGELEQVTLQGKKAFILAEDHDQLFSEPHFPRDLLLLGAHDPYLDQRDRHILQPDKTRHQCIWKTVSNPGAIVYRGEVIGTWVSKKKATGLDITFSLWGTLPHKEALREHAKVFAHFRQQTPLCTNFS